MANPIMLADMYEAYVKPSLGGQLILRKPHSHQTSQRVRDAQIKFAEKASGNNIAGACKGKKGRSFYACLRTKGYERFH